MLQGQEYNDMQKLLQRSRQSLIARNLNQPSQYEGPEPNEETYGLRVEV
jgi:hypothetical protein